MPFIGAPVTYERYTGDTIHIGSSSSESVVIGANAIYDRTATDTVHLSPVASRGPATFPRSASNAVNLTPSAVATATRSYSASAQSAIHLTPAASATRLAIHAASALDTVRFTTGAVASMGTVHSASAADFVQFFDGLDIPPARTYFRSATARITLAATPAVLSTKAVAAIDRVNFSSLARLQQAGPQTYAFALADSIRLRPSARLAGPFTYQVKAKDTIRVKATPSYSATRIYRVSAADSVSFPSTASDSTGRVIRASASDLVRFQGASDKTASRIYFASAGSTITLAPTASARATRLMLAADSLALGSRASRSIIKLVSASDSIRLSSAAKQSRAFPRLATDAISLHASSRSNAFHDGLATSSFSISATPVASIVRKGGTSGVTLADAATVSVLLDGGGDLDGGDSNSGLRAISYARVDGAFPMSYAETQGGLILIADGVDPMLRWDGLSGVATTAGVSPPATPIALGGAGVGLITGIRRSYCRFIDGDGNPSNLSPPSDPIDFGYDASIWGLTANHATGIVTIDSPGHGLKTGEIVIFRDVISPPLDGPHAVSVLDLDRFTIAPPGLSREHWNGTGSWTMGLKTVAYQSVPVPTESKVARRQILRNLDGFSDVYYVDIDTTDLTSTTFFSTALDDELSTGEAVPLLSAEDFPLAMRFGVPPSHKAIVASHMGRIFAAGDVTIKVGNAAPTLGSATVQGIATDWRSTFAGRLLYVAGASRPYEIASVDEAKQVITLSGPYKDPSKAYATYAIRSAPGERKLIYYSEPAAPESWPPWNAIAVPEDNDEITGLMVKTSFLYIIERRHIYRFTQQDEPAEGLAFLAVNRGCLNGRCFATADSTTYLLDEAGIYAFDGDQSVEPVSAPIQTIFQSDGLIGGLSVDWASDQTLWHAAHDAVRDTIRWFVSMAGSGGIYHAICYDYRLRRWWIERYPSPVTSSTTETIGHRRSLVGCDARRVLCLSEGALDVVADSTDLAGLATSGDPTTLIDTSATFPANLDGVPVSISDGTGRGQQRVIVANTSQALTIREPWDTIPDATSAYQVGGVPWTWRSGWFDYVNDEDQNPRDIALTYQPTSNPATIDVQLFLDHAIAPMNWGYAVDQDGVRIEAGDPNMTVSLLTRPSRSGWSLQRIANQTEMYGYGEQFVSVQMNGVQGPESIRVFQLEISGAVAEGDSK